MGGTPYSARIIEDVDRALEVLSIVFYADGAAVEGLTDRNGHKRKDVGEGGKCQLGRCNNQR